MAAQQWTFGGFPPPDNEEEPNDIEETPPGEHKREPLKDPDPADTAQ
jgi:hypothetical protein